MSLDPPAPSPVIQHQETVPAEWDHLLARCDAPEFTATAAWCTLAARHYPDAGSLYLTASLDGTVVGGLPILVRTRRGTTRLESSLEGTLAGPQVVADLPQAVRRTIAAVLCGALADRLGGRRVVAAMTVIAGSAADPGADLDDQRWQRQQYDSAVVDCRGGIDHVERDLWTNNRRNERNRGLKRGCTLHAEQDPSVVAQWYPLYVAEAAAWAQAPVPLAFLQDLLTEAAPHCVFNAVRHEGAVIAGHFCFRSRGRLVAWQGAVRPDVQGTLFPTTLVYWQDLSLACDEGMTGVDFGGCIGRDSLWEFKRRCGALPESRCQLTARSVLGRLVQTIADRWRGRAS